MAKIKNVIAYSIFMLMRAYDKFQLLIFLVKTRRRKEEKQTNFQ